MIVSKRRRGFQKYEKMRRMLHSSVSLPPSCDFTVCVAFSLDFRVVIIVFTSKLFHGQTRGFLLSNRIWTERAERMSRNYCLKEANSSLVWWCLNAAWESQQNPTPLVSLSACQCNIPFTSIWQPLQIEWPHTTHVDPQHNSVTCHQHSTYSTDYELSMTGQDLLTKASPIRSCLAQDARTAVDGACHFHTVNSLCPPCLATVYSVSCVVAYISWRLNQDCMLTLHT